MMNFETIDTGCINDEDLPWVPFLPYNDQVAHKMFKIDPIQGEMVLMMKAPGRAELAPHHHTGIVIVHTVQGAWKYKEHDWVARPGSCVYETAATSHTPEAVSDEEVITFVYIKGELHFLDEDGRTVAVETWRTAMERYLAHCKTHGIVPRDLTSFSK